MPCIMGGFKSKLQQGANALDVLNLVSGKKVAVSPQNDPDEKWSNLYRERQRNHLYKWVDVNKGGDLLETYDEDADEGVVRFANERIAPLLYNDGTLLEKICFSDYAKWKKAMDANISGGGEGPASDEELEQLQKKFAEHNAQWKLNKRGIDGETVIHLLLSRNDAKCAEIAKLLIKLYPGLAVDIYEGDEFYGQSPLHLAIVHDDFDMVSVLLEAGADIRCRATGRFFLPEDQKKAKKATQTNYAGFAYYGEYPLAFAASFGNKDIYDYLIQCGADPNAQDSFGNTVLHICVINSSIEMYSYAVRHWEKPADTDICNFAGYTPLTLATILGRREIFEAMLELTKMEFWRFSDMACSAYPLTTLDTIHPDGSTNWDSALMRVVNGATADHMDIVGSEVIQRLLADKWRSFGHKKMYQRLIFLIVHLLTLSIAIYIRPENADDLWGRHGAADVVRYFFECALLFSSSTFLIYQQGSEIRAQGLRGYLKTVVRAPDKIIFLVSNILILACVPCRVTEQYTLEETLLALALPGSWTYLLFFAKGYLLTGPFVIMIYSMISGDMVRFAVISLIFLVSFSQAFFFLGKDMQERQRVGTLCSVSVDDHIIVDYDAYTETALTLFRMSMGGYDYEQFDCAAYKGFTKILFVIYMIIMPIMLINMLIAMMGNTYTTIISQAEKAWRQQWAQLVILLERALDKRKLAKYQTEYSIKLSDDRFDQDDPGAMETRALMVIKQTRKTRAKQRKQATASWKRLSRKVMAMVRNHGADRSRQVLHSHGQQHAVLMMISRPVSAAGVYPVHAMMSSSVQQRSRMASAVLGQSQGSRMEHAVTISRVVNTLRNSPLQPPAVPGFDGTSPQLLVHRPNNLPTSDTPMPAERRSLASMNHLSIDYHRSSSVTAAPAPPAPAAGTVLGVAQAALPKGQSIESEPQNLDAVPVVSSPSTPGKSSSSKTAYHGSAGADKKAPRPEDPVTPDALRKMSFQLHSLDVEQLLSAHHRPRGPTVAAQIRKRHFASRLPIGPRTNIVQPNVPPGRVFLTQSTESANENGGDGHSAAVSAFLDMTSVNQLPNMPLDENGAQASPGGDETTSFHEDEYDTGSIRAIVASPRKSNSAGTTKRKATSPAGKKTTRSSVDKGKRTKKKP